MNDEGAQAFDPATGEIPREQPREEVIDTRNEPWAARSLGSVIDMLERGAFSQEAYLAMMALGKGITELAGRTNKQQKGKLTINLNLKSEGDAFFIEADFKVTAPKEPRPRTMAWQSDEGHFMPSMPKQKLLFGVAGTEHGPRSVGGVREIRTVP